jgi:hypothetical protein
MEAELKTLLEETLNEYGKINFDVTYVTKGCVVEMEIGDKINEKCGLVYEDLSGWLGYDEFVDYLMSHGVQHNYRGEIFLENEEICFLLTLNGYCYEYDDSDRRYIYFDEEFITNELNIELSQIGMDDFYDEENLSVQFYKLKDSPIERLELSYYNEGWHQIELDDNQIEILTDFIESEILLAEPSYDIDFDCEIQWEVESDEKNLDFNYWSTPIKLTLNDIVSEKN